MPQRDFASCYIHIPLLPIPVYASWTSINPYLYTLFLLVLFFCLMSLPCQTLALECDKNLKPTNAANAYSARGNRCEGFYSTKKVAGQFGLIGYIKGRMQFDEKANDILEISLPVGLRTQYANVNLRAQAFSPMTYYRMDASFNSKQSFQWPSADVLKPEQLNDEKIGVYGYIKHRGGNEQNDTIIYLPLTIKSTSYPDVADKDLRLFFSSFIDIDFLREQWVCGDKQLPHKDHEKIYHSGKPILIFPPDNKSGLCLLKLTGVAKHRDVSGVSNLVETVAIIQLDK